MKQVQTPQPVWNIFHFNFKTEQEKGKKYISAFD